MNLRRRAGAKGIPRERVHPFSFFNAISPLLKWNRVWFELDHRSRYEELLRRQRSISLERDPFS